MAREIAPKMLQNYKEQKHNKQQKHIEMLQKKKDEIIKIKHDIDTYGGQWLLEKDIEKSQHVTKS